MQVPAWMYSMSTKNVPRVKKEIIEVVRMIPVNMPVSQIWKKSSTEVRLTSATEDR